MSDGRTPMEQQSRSAQIDERLLSAVESGFRSSHERMKDIEQRIGEQNGRVGKLEVLISKHTVWVSIFATIVTALVAGVTTLAINAVRNVN